MAETAKTSKQLMNEMLANAYINAAKAKENGELVCWATGIAPQEFMETMGIATLYPENFGAAMGAKHYSGHFCDVAEANGYSIDICSYARNHFGYIAEGMHVDDVNLVKPDFILCCTNTCVTVLKWYENLAKEWGIPCLMFDTPFVYEEQSTSHQAEYLEAQCYHIIRQLEEITGRTFDMDKFKRVMEISMETVQEFKHVVELGKATPSPYCGFDLFNYMGVMVFNRGTEAARDLMRLWAKECEEKIARGEGPWTDQEERFRILWDGIACWPQLSLTYKTLKKYGINMVASNYPNFWILDYDEPTPKAMGRAYAECIAMNRDIPYDLKNFRNLGKNWNLDGIISHSNRSCKPMDFKQYEVRRIILEETGLPSVIFDGDQTDPDVFSAAQFETRIQSLVEIMEKNKYKKA